MDSISDLVESQSRLLEALQLSHPAELELKKVGSSEGRTQSKLSLNPIYRQVPRVLERCCSHIETHGEGAVTSTMVTVHSHRGEMFTLLFVFVGLQTVGIFRVGSSKKRVRQVGSQAGTFHFLVAKAAPLFMKHCGHMTVRDAGYIVFSLARTSCLKFWTKLSSSCQQERWDIKIMRECRADELWYPVLEKF